MTAHTVTPADTIALTSRMSSSLHPAGRVNIAFDDGPLEPHPVWTRIDTVVRVAGIDISRGRQTETETTDTSTASVHLNDTAGLFDPSNVSSPYFGNLDGRQIALSLWNPVTSQWVMQYRGVIDDYGYVFNPAPNAAGEPLIANVTISCVDVFDYLAGVEMIPGLFGQTPPAGSEGVVFYEEGPVQTRIEDLLADAGIDPDMAVVFTGNVDVQQTKYDAGDSILIALRDACDAEFPGIANMYTDKKGRFVFHGRFARFDPEGTEASATEGAWEFTRWKAGDGTAVALDASTAQIRPPLQWSRPRSRICNAAMCYPRFPLKPSGGAAGTFDETDIPGQIVTDATSITAYGYRAWSALDLITLAGTTTGNTALLETKAFADWRVQNFKDPRTIIEALTFKSIRPDDTRGPATWDLICRQDVSDVVELTHGYPGGAGIAENFYIEGSQMTIRPLNPTYDMVELTLNVSPESYYNTDVFT